MAYGYIDAVPGTHDYHTQHFSILSHAAAYGLGQVNFIHEVVPEDNYGNKSILSGMLDNLHRGNALIVTGFQNLGNSTLEVLDALSTISRRGVRLYVATGFRLDCNEDALAVATACSLLKMIEKELELRSDPAPAPSQMPSDDADIQTPARRTRRSKLDGREEEIRSMLAEGVSLNLIARTLDLTSRQSLSDFIHSRNLYIPGQ